MIPDYQTLMLPILKACTNGELVSREMIVQLAVELNLPVHHYNNNRTAQGYPKREKSEINP